MGSRIGSRSASFSRRSPSQPIRSRSIRSSLAVSIMPVSALGASRTKALAASPSSAACCVVSARDSHAFWAACCFRWTGICSGNDRTFNANSFPFLARASLAPASSRTGAVLGLIIATRTTYSVPSCGSIEGASPITASCWRAINPLRRA